MRLMCPNCDAVYSVDDAAIPKAGRDVQCSNCGHGWFQMHPETEAAAGRTIFGEDDAEGGAEAPPDRAVPRPAIAPEPADGGEDDGPDAGQSPAADADLPANANADVTAARARLSDNLLAILREEAARETAERRAEAPRMPEVQPELALPEAATAAPPAPAAAGVPDLDMLEAGQMAGDRPAPRRDLLPDIEEINSTLRAGSETRNDEALAAAPAARPRGGFRAGFVTMVVIAGLLVAAYVMAPRIAEHVPGAAPIMSGYVATMDGARLWVDRTMQEAAGALRGLSGEDG